MVRTKEGVGAVVAWSNSSLSHAGIVRRAFAATQEVLDLRSIDGEDDLAIRDLHSQFLVWWTEGTDCVLRAVSTSTGAFGIRLDISGTPSYQPPEWRPSFRFFRFSQVTDDLFDAFRNMYLAFESEVSMRFKKRDDGEREEEWLKRALVDMGLEKSLDIARFVRDIYKVRKGTFHAKIQKSPLIPQEVASDREVENALARLTDMYLGMVPGKRSGGATVAGFERMAEAILSMENLTVAVASERQTPDNIAVGRYGQEASLKTRMAASLDTSKPFQRHVKGTTSAAALSSLPHLGGFLLRGGQETLATFDLEGLLTLQGVDRFEVLLRLRLTNQREPKNFSWADSLF